MEIVGGVVGADEIEVGGGHRLFDFGRGVVEVASGFDFAIAECADLFQGAVVLFGQLLAYGIELEAERDVEGWGGG